MKKTNQIITIHLGVLVLYSLTFAIWMNYSDAGDDYPNPYKWLGFMFLQAIMILGHAITIAILASNQHESKPEYAKAHWLSLGFVFLLGGSICFVAPELFVDRFY